MATARFDSAQVPVALGALSAKWDALLVALFAAVVGSLVAARP